MDKQEVQTQVKIRCGALVTLPESEAIGRILTALSECDIPHCRCHDLLEICKDEIEEYPIKAGNEEYEYSDDDGEE